MIFKIVPQHDLSFSVSMRAGDGRLTAIDGFGSKHEASAWIVQTERMFHLPGTPIRNAVRH